MLARYIFLTMLVIYVSATGQDKSNWRKPKSDDDLQAWLENMIVYHRFLVAEVTSATGLTDEQVRAAIKRFELADKSPPKRKPGEPLVVLPYPGGRHPRIGFLDGAIRPQRETKISVFTPWDEKSYVVVDVPEAIWVGTGDARELLYLAHTHVPTMWTRQGIELEPLEWKREPDGTLQLERKLPNGVKFGTKITPTESSVKMEMWITNTTKEKLTGLRVQNCVMLKRATGFNQQNNDNKVTSKPFVACHNKAGDRWIITAWEPCLRPWSNERCPCMHSDPQFPDCEPGATQRITGWLSFYEGRRIEEEFRRIQSTNEWFVKREYWGSRCRQTAERPRSGERS